MIIPGWGRGGTDLDHTVGDASLLSSLVGFSHHDIWSSRMDILAIRDALKLTAQCGKLEPRAVSASSQVVNCSLKVFQMSEFPVLTQRRVSRGNALLLQLFL